MVNFTVRTDILIYLYYSISIRNGVHYEHATQPVASRPNKTAADVDANQVLQRAKNATVSDEMNVNPDIT